MNLEMALKSGSNNLDLDCVKLSLRNFFLSFLMESFFYQLLGSTFIFVPNTHQKAAHLIFGLILPVAKVPWCFLEGQFKLSYLLNKWSQLNPNFLPSRAPTNHPYRVSWHIKLFIPKITKIKCTLNSSLLVCNQFLCLWFN